VQDLYDVPLSRLIADIAGVKHVKAPSLVGRDPILPAGLSTPSELTKSVEVKKEDSPKTVTRQVSPSPRRLEAQDS